MKDVFLKPKIVVGIAALIALVIGVFAFNRVGRAPLYETTTATLADVSGTITLSGTIEGSTPVNLAFAQGGRVAAVNVKEGQAVASGALLSTLDAGTTLGALTQAKAALELVQAQNKNTSLNLQNTTAQQNILVENAYRTLLSSGLAARSNNIDEGHNPTISGTYTCDKEGSYKITPYASGAMSGYSFTYSGLEEGSGPVTFNTSQPLGHCGLFITFAPNFSGATTWTVDLPNTQNALYITNKSAYDLAVATREKTLSELSATLSGTGTTTTQAALDAATGSYQAALGAYQNTIITAPSAGTISFINDDLKSGQTVQPGTTMISVTPTNTYQIESYVSTDDASRLPIGTIATVTLEAMPDKTYHASVVSHTLAPTAQGKDESYHVVFVLTDADKSIVSGSNVHVTIVGDTKTNTLSIPRGALMTTDDGHSVLVVTGHTTRTQVVQTGVIGSDRVEILSGLAEGETVAILTK